MKHPISAKILPYFTLIAGVAGFRLRVWLFSAMDEKQLLPANHPAGICLYILTAVVLAVLLLTTRKLTARPVSRKKLRSYHIFSAFCYLLGALGLAATAMSGFSGNAIRLGFLVTPAVAAGSLVMLVMAVFKLLGRPLPYGLPALLTVALMLNAVAQCQILGIIPQLQVYFFPLLACVFLILSAYQKTVFAAGKGKPARLAFFSQGAVFFCFVSLQSDQWPLYFGLLFWSAAQLYPLLYTKKEA